ncbi:hypothetical protein [Streptomyces sp. R33]|uniref:Uncharacterized protein n=1 Tax=Streptomyces sp. R33 TaxID=3238629 RepID=A0AB39Y655_9ACTN
MVMPDVHAPAPDPAERRGRWSRLATGAELPFIAQLVVAGAVFIATTGMRDDHDVTFGAGFAAAVPRLILLVVLAAYLHWLLFTLPAMALARLLGGPRWEAARGALCAVAGAAVLTAAHAWWVTSLWDVPFVPAAAWIAGAGVLPVTAAWYARHRWLWWGGMLARVGALTGIALLVTALGGFLQVRTGFHAYEPPRLERSQYVGEWVGGGGAYRLSLRENGEAEVGNLPPGKRNSGLWEACSGTGTWHFEPKHESGGIFHRGPRDRVSLSIGGCSFGDWQVAGTADQPELFYVVRDPDGPGGPDVTTLHRV